MSNYNIISKAINNYLETANEINEFIIYPFGYNGYLTKQILNVVYGKQEKYIIDNNLSKHNSNIKDVGFLKKLDCSKYVILVTVEKDEVCKEIVDSVADFIPRENLIVIFEEQIKKRQEDEERNLLRGSCSEVIDTKVGKYSTGPLCSHWLVESVGNFSSFARGTDVVPNHCIGLLSSHAFLFLRKDGVHSHSYEEYEKVRDGLLPGVHPKGTAHKLRKITIGHDVWLGRNVLIANGANIGNGVIAAAGAVITKDVPDYAVVGGVPAKIIKYRYNEEQIKKLNEIAWWNWSDDKIRENYDDFYEDVDVFIKKHWKEK